MQRKAEVKLDTLMRGSGFNTAQHQRLAQLIAARMRKRTNVRKVKKKETAVSKTKKKKKLTIRKIQQSKRGIKSKKKTVRTVADIFT